MGVFIWGNGPIWFLPAIINLIKKIYKVAKIDTIGLIQGTLIFFLAYMNNP